MRLLTADLEGDWSREVRSGEPPPPAGVAETAVESAVPIPASSRGLAVVPILPRLVGFSSAAAADGSSVSPEVSRSWSGAGLSTALSISLPDASEKEMLACLVEL